MKSALIGIAVVLSLLLVSPAAESIGNLGITGPDRSSSTDGEAALGKASVPGEDKIKIPGAFGADGDQAAHRKATAPLPISLLFLTGLFGIAFWDNSSWKKLTRDCA